RYLIEVVAGPQRNQPIRSFDPAVASAGIVFKTCAPTDGAGDNRSLGAVFVVGDQNSIEHDIAAYFAIASNPNGRAIGDRMHAVGTNQLTRNLYPIRVGHLGLAVGNLLLLRTQHPARDKQKTGDGAQDTGADGVFHSSS